MRIPCSTQTLARALLALIPILGLSAPAAAEIFINEIFFDPGGGGTELRDEFIELRGTPGMSLANHFLIFIENEDNDAHNGGAGLIDNIFDLGSASLGSNGFLTLRQRGDPAADPPNNGPSQYVVAPGTTDLVNMGDGPGFGSGDGSTIGAEDDLDEGKIENGGFTAMIIRNDGDAETNRPTIAFDLDEGNDGLDVPTGREDWVILDAVGVHAEPREAVFGRTYAPINFGIEGIGQLVFIEDVGLREADPGLEPGATYVDLDFDEVEYIARWGNSTGQTEADWHVSNLTDNPGSGSQGAPLDYRQSFTGEHGDLASGDTSVPPRQPTVDDGKLESNQGVPYGTKLLNNVGAPNYITGDFNGDGVVDAADYTFWLASLGATATELAHEPADANHDFLVDATDYALWKANFGAPLSPAAAAASPSAAVPEPTAAILLLIAGITAVTCRVHPV